MGEKNWAIVAGERVWVGPVSGIQWKRRYDTEKWRGKPKTAPTWNFCVPYGRYSHKKVCLAAIHEACAKCPIPGMYIFSFPLKRAKARIIRAMVVNNRFGTVDSSKPKKYTRVFRFKLRSPKAEQLVPVKRLVWKKTK